jgi:SAM-dependent methyltransferase
VKSANGRRARLKALMGPQLTVLARCVLRGRPLPQWGNLRRLEPFSTAFGSDRGTPVDRYYLHGFLEGNRTFVTGRVLEVQMPSYTQRFGENVRESHTVDIDPKFSATFTCDLAEAAQIPSDNYDCFLVPNTLQHLAELAPALRTMLRIVRPGGTILASVAALLPLISDGGDYWRLSADGWRRVLSVEWPGCDVTVEARGNCLAAVAAMYGLAQEELSEHELDAYDPRYPVLITIRCRKPLAS